MYALWSFCEAFNTTKTFLNNMQCSLLKEEELNDCFLALKEQINIHKENFKQLWEEEGGIQVYAISSTLAKSCRSDTLFHILPLWSCQAHSP